SAPPSSIARRRTTIDAQTGHWDLGKTIGAGSMGKVKLARNRETGEQVAVKIVPRQSADGEHRSLAERERADRSKEVRTARETAIVTLVDHPYICGMRDVVRTNYHWYMLFEYVNGGQMLDYIISHGRVKEKQARKFGRQIASALDYCHRNSIVHRDLKIENILISKNGDIKIIDFGLSNLFSPKGLLKTFCGSLYFAAPELLQARQYTGPEVDVWSFGIVLYVLVCGKVPFDDQSMPQLHAKIKRGYVEYPPWLSPECKGLIGRALTTNPQERATMHEILNHPWMNKGYNGPPDNHLPHRAPLQLPLDPAVIDKMTGFDFGSAEFITAQLTKTIESEDYQRAVRALEKKGAQTLAPEQDRKRGVFDFYKRRNSTNSRDTFNTPSSEAVQLGSDPTMAYNPLISVYYLAREKMEREARERNPGAFAIPQAPGEMPLPVPGLPELPRAAYTNAQTYEMPGEKPTGGRTRPRARTHGEDESQPKMQNVNLQTAPSPMNPAIVEPYVEPQSPPPRRENPATSLFRRLSTRRSKDSSDRWVRPSSERATAETPRKSFSVRRTRDRSSSRSRMPETPRTANLPPVGEKKPQGLGRSISVNSSDMRRRFSRRGVSEGHAFKFPDNSASNRPCPIRETESDTESNSYEARRAAARRSMRRTSGVPEETDQEMQDESGGMTAGTPTDFKPVFLKGVFSVSTTSSKPLYFIRSDIIRVLNELGVEYSPLRGGFRCKHAPSPSGAKVGDRRRFSAEQRQREVGETSTHVQSDLGGSSALKFEIFVVKVPLINLHGVQFKKIEGGTWQYKAMAQRILERLRL
ncbi:Pkinase-domain-containing protein, partial [Piedraia hortae CBS 480.64]